MGLKKFHKIKNKGNTTMKERLLEVLMRSKDISDMKWFLDDLLDFNGYVNERTKLYLWVCKKVCFDEKIIEELQNIVKKQDEIDENWEKLGEEICHETMEFYQMHQNKYYEELETITNSFFETMFDYVLKMQKKG